VVAFAAKSATSCRLRPRTHSTTPSATASTAGEAQVPPCTPHPSAPEMSARPFELSVSPVRAS